MLTLIENGDVYAPVPLGRKSVFLTDGKIAKIGAVDRRAVEALGLECDVVDATGCVVTPGLIDPHEHLLGGSGEEGFKSQTPEFFVSEIVRWGITTVVGTLGVDTTMKTLPGLLAKVKALGEEGLNAYMWTGGYDVPPTSIMRSVRDDIMFIDEVIGVGEVAIADKRGKEPDARAIARIATDAYNGGKLAKKAGVTHFHVGDGGERLAVLREVIEDFEVEPSWLYATHIERSEELMREAIELAAVGVGIDIDVAEEDLAKWVRFYLDNGGDLAQLTASSDAGLPSPRTLYEQVCECVVKHRLPLEQILPVVTSNTARILKLAHKGSLEQEKEGDVLVMKRDSLEIVHVWSKGQCMVRDGELEASEGFLDDSNREIRLQGRKRKKEG